MRPLDESVIEAIKYCIRNNILKRYLEENSSEVLNMLLEEWNLDEAKEYWKEEAREEGLEEGREQGREQGLKQGLKQGLEQTARNALVKGYSLEEIHEITGLDIETVRKLQVDMKKIE
jgi:predicted transposase/invertase (TIGR01784 family)